MKQDRQSTCNVTLRRVRVATGNAINITYSARVFGALDLQHAKRMRRIIVISFAYCPAVFFHVVS
jgi:hypothetical protein